MRSMVEGASIADPPSPPRCARHLPRTRGRNLPDQPCAAARLAALATAFREAVTMSLSMPTP